jgi:chromate transporter
MVLITLFLAFLRTGFFAIGGAYSFLPLLEKELVENHQWLSKSEFLEVVGLAEVLPGAISIKFATYTGYKVAGVPGAIVANIANLLPPVSLMVIALMIYSKYRDIPTVKAALKMVKYAVFAMIIALAFKTIDKSGFFQFKYLAVIVVSFALFAFTKTHPALVILGAALFGGLINQLNSV